MQMDERKIYYHFSVAAFWSSVSSPHSDQQPSRHHQQLRQLHHLLHLRPQVQEDLPEAGVQSSERPCATGRATPLPQSTQGQQTDRQMVRQMDGHRDR